MIREFPGVTLIKMSSSELRPRKVELMHAHYIQNSAMTTESILHIITEPVFVLTKTSQPYGSDIHYLIVSLRSSLNP